MWERKFLGFRLDRKKRIGIAPESVKRFRERVRELWDGRRSRSSNQLRDDWICNYEAGGDTTDWPKREPPSRAWKGGSGGIFGSASGLRWHSRRGRLRRLRHLGIGERGLGIAYHSGGSVADVSAPGAEQRAEQRSAAPAWLSIPQRS